MNKDNIKWLTTAQASDENFKKHLKNATIEEINEARYIMLGQFKEGNASRVKACLRELRERDRLASD